MDVSNVGGWTIEEIAAVAEHTEECKTKGCPGRYPDFNECTVADLCKGILDLISEIKGELSRDKSKEPSRD